MKDDPVSDSDAANLAKQERLWKERNRMMDVILSMWNKAQEDRRSKELQFRLRLEKMEAEEKEKAYLESIA